MSAKLFVGNLSPDTTGDELRELFAGAGVVESCQLITDRDTGRSKGFGFIEMNSREAADTAKEKFNGQDLRGRALKVDDAKPKTDHQNKAGYSSSGRS
jgi:cold-inducible RNA-binding protein